MWSAIKNDLFEFVTTVQADTTNTLAQVVGGAAVDDVPKDVEKDKIEGMKYALETYSEDVDINDRTEFQHFILTFSISANASEISKILDSYPEVAKYFSDLVPSEISSEIFWARYFFKVNSYRRTHLNQISEEDDEELTWEEPEPTINECYSTANTLSNPTEDNESPDDDITLPPISSTKGISESNAQHLDECFNPPIQSSIDVDSIVQENEYLRTKMLLLENEVRNLQNLILSKDTLIDTLQLKIEEQTVLLNYMNNSHHNKISSHHEVTRDNTTHDSPTAAFVTSMTMSDQTRGIVSASSSSSNFVNMSVPNSEEEKDNIQVLLGSVERAIGGVVYRNMSGDVRGGGEGEGEGKDKGAIDAMVKSGMHAVWEGGERCASPSSSSSLPIPISLPTSAHVLALAPAPSLSCANEERAKAHVSESVKHKPATSQQQPVEMDEEDDEETEGWEDNW